MVGKGNLIKWGDIVVQSDAVPLNEMKFLLDAIIRDHGNPSFVQEQKSTETITDLFSEFDAQAQKGEGEKKKEPWEL